MRRPGLRLPTWIEPVVAACLLAVSLQAASPLASSLRQDQRTGPLELTEAATCFAELSEACARDAGKLWGLEVCGPVLLVDPATRALIANQADAEGQLVARDGVFVGTLPKDQPIANAPLEWAGVRWAMAVVLYLGETRAQRVALLAHESFHRVQPELGLFVLGDENAHLAERDGRVWLQLEWNALQTALAAEGEARRAAVQDALDFRAARRARYPGAAERENVLELREGLASYTGQRLAGWSEAEVVADCATRRAREETFNRSFAYYSGPLYGYLLDGTGVEWRRSLTGTSDLGAELAAALALVPRAERAPQRTGSHGGDALRASEEVRERERLERLAAWRRTLVDGPVLVLDLSQVTSASMDTRRVFPFEPGRTVYTLRKLIARFGTLAVDGGAILEDAATRLGRVSLLDAAEDHLSGPGWKLELAPGWRLEPGERAGDVVVRAGI